MSINVSSETEVLIKGTDTFTREKLEEIESEATILKLMNMGVIVPYASSSPEDLEDRREAVLVIQPHSDDFAMSCGGTLARLHNVNRCKINCVTVFSSCSAQSFPWRHKVRLSDEEYSKLRMNEDIFAMNYLHGSNYFLGYKDSIARGAGLSVILREGILKKDTPMLASITTDLRELIEDYKPDMILLPAAFGWHYDHRITLAAAREALNTCTGSSNVYIYEDYPYCDQSRYNYWGRLKELKNEFDIKPVYIDIEQYIKSKASLIHFYRSQFVNWDFKSIKKSITELAVSTSIEARFQGHCIEDKITAAERIWEVCHGGFKHEEN